MHAEHYIIHCRICAPATPWCARIQSLLSLSLWLPLGRGHVRIKNELVWIDRIWIAWETWTNVDMQIQLLNPTINIQFHFNLFSFKKNVDLAWCGKLENFSYSYVENVQSMPSASIIFKNEIIILINDSLTIAMNEWQGEWKRIYNIEWLCHYNIHCFLPSVVKSIACDRNGERSGSERP